MFSNGVCLPKSDLATETDQVAAHAGRTLMETFVRPPGMRSVRSYGWSVIACAIILLGICVMQFGALGSESTRRWITDFAYVPLAAVSTALCLRTAMDRRLDERTRLAWKVMAGAVACKLFADLAWWWLDALTHEPVPFPSVADIGFLAFIPLTLVAMLLYPSRPLSRQQRFRLLLDVATVVAGAFMVLWYLVLGPVVKEQDLGPLAAMTAAAYPLGDLVLVVGIVTALLRGPGRAARRPLQILLVALAVHVVADVYYGLINLHSGFIGGTWPDLCFLAATLLFGVAAAEQRLGAERADPADDDTTGPRRSISRLPYAAVAVGYGLLLIVAREFGWYPLGGLLLGAVTLTGLVVLRQVSALRDNETLIVTDNLTGLATRALLHENLERALVRLRGDERTAVLLFDLDDFKLINDEHGHGAGDTVLVHFADILRSSVRSSDLPARLGGDEFAVLLPLIHNLDAAEIVARRVIDHLRAPVDTGGQALRLRASIGIALSGEDVTDGKELLHRADMAMYRAKRRGLHHFEVYGVAPDEVEEEAAQLSAELRHATERGQLFLLYQPIVSLHDGRMHGVEALVRWQHPTRGVVPPLDFIPLAEEIGVIEEIGAWVLENACAQVADWRRRLVPDQDLHLSVNLSPQQMRNPHIVEEFEEILQRTGFEPQSLVLELTEGQLVGHNDEIVAKLVALRRAGVRIAIDDFGTGYSSLAYLTRLPIDILKIDRCFIAEMSRGSESSAVAEAIIRLSQVLHLETVAEGIETASQAASVQQMGCPLGQGYHFARPLDADAIEARLAEDLDAMLSAR